MIAKYGQPQEVTANRLIWHDNGPWKFSQLVNEADDADDLLAYDGSLILERTKGELSARCDKEEANFLAINLAHEVATGKRTVDDARRFDAESVQQMMKPGKPNEYLQGFRFIPPTGDQGDRDRPFGPIATTGRR